MNKALPIIGAAAGVISIIIGLCSLTDCAGSQPPVIVQVPTTPSAKNVALYLDGGDMMIDSEATFLFVFSDPPLKNKEISIEYSHDQQKWSWTDNAITGNDGKVSIQWKIPKTGPEFYIRAKFVGDNEYNPAISDPLPFPH